MIEKMTPIQAAIDLTISVHMAANRQISQINYIDNPYLVALLWSNSTKGAEK